MIESFKVNSLGPLLVSKYFSKFLKNNSGGFIFNISSYLASIELNQSGSYYSYRVSKTALNSGNSL
jgi:NAD(P)-dependent dehydrogenase (short-subunit alcohol dehydrogenase family)